MTFNFSTLACELIHPFILKVTLNRPESRNAINHIMMRELRDLWQCLYNHPETLRCIILTGQGSAFCAGADLKERLNLSLPEWRTQHTYFQQAMQAMADCPLPIIAAVNGAAFGGGLELTLASDFAYSADDAIFSQSEVKLGLMPGAGGTQNLPRAVGLKRAKELIFTGTVFSAQDAESWGIINKVCAKADLMPAVLQTAEIICQNAPLAIKQAKKALNKSQDVDVKSGFQFELEAYQKLLETADLQEGIRAFNAKRKPEFSGA